MHEAISIAVEAVEGDPDFQLNPDGALDGRAAARWADLTERCCTFNCAVCMTPALPPQPLR